jgi:predicted lipid-binding transport protein (Tim44 family)
MLVLSLSGLAVSGADARRGGSFGSRGARTYMAPRQAEGSSRYVPPVERSMTSRSPSQAAPSYNPGFGQSQSYRPAGSRFGGFGGGLVGGLIAGGLIGHFFGGGWNAGGAGSGGMLAALLQIALLGGIVWLVVGFFRRRQQPAPPAYSSGYARADGYSPSSQPAGSGGVSPQDNGVDIAITPNDQRDFERLLGEVQDAFGREDYARLRQVTTPEIMSYLSEELSQNATQGVRNEVSGTTLVAADVSEAWREATADYATIALRYESIDLMRNRATGAVVSGSPTEPSETMEYWTFVRGGDGVWKVSAIQEA